MSGAQQDLRDAVAGTDEEYLVPESKIPRLQNNSMLATRGNILKSPDFSISPLASTYRNNPILEYLFRKD